ncbi:hypothetical protein B0H19DRAFT_1059832 [Mycena capillaripes]|nr:hypothetical protein B0H19DRAFT_1059832 [Mycena capillaripes]
MTAQVANHQAEKFAGRQAVVPFKSPRFRHPEINTDISISEGITRRGPNNERRFPGIFPASVNYTLHRNLRLLKDVKEPFEHSKKHLTNPIMRFNFLSIAALVGLATTVSAQGTSCPEAARFGNVNVSPTTDR